MFRFGFRTRLIAVLAVVVCAGFGNAQKSDEKELTIPDPVDQAWETKDGVALRATYYPGGFFRTTKGIVAKDGKQVVPIILLHGWGGDRSDYALLAKGLQSLGHAVLVPDLRGHGQSTTYKLPNGDSKPIDREKIKPADLRSTIQDVERCKKFLLEENNAVRLNIEQLCVVGSEFGALVALDWAVQDWSWPQLINRKQGKDVKALVLLSPPASHKGWTSVAALKDQNVRKMSLLIVAGSKVPATYQEAQRIHRLVEPAHPTKFETDDDRNMRQDLFLATPDTNLQGTKMLRPDLPVNKEIASFIARRLVLRADQLPWTLRE